jgi:DUF438 domain-containing protein
MSEHINNREYRQKVLKELIMELHNGKSVAEIKPRFEELIQGISPMEISEMEQGLIMEGMPVEEIQSLCDVHAAVFKGSIEEIHRPQKPEEIPGHPVHTFKLENREIEKLINEKINPYLEAFKTSGSSEKLKNLNDDFNRLWEIDKHYLRKENLLFPYMEKYGITAPPKVMWGVDDEIRALIKESKALISNYNGNQNHVSDKLSEAVNKVSDMIFKEENILFPMVLETLSEDEWQKIAEESDELGYCLVEPKGKWKPIKISIEEKEQEKGDIPSNNGYIKFETGILSPEEISGMLNTLPLDISFVDKDGAVKYFSQGKERIFPRTKAIIGRQVQNCHPPASVHIVEKIVEDLRSGKKDHEDFWINMRGQFVYIRYFAVRNERNEFLGILEVTQNIKPIQEITGEKRLVSD